MDAMQFLYLADELLKTPGHAHLRSAVSRAYYAAHHRIKSFLQSAGIPLLKNHGDVWKHLADLGDAEMDQLGAALAALHSERVKADYNLSEPRIETAATATAIVTQARTMIATVDRCQVEAERCEKLKEAIRLRHQTLTSGPPT